MLRTRVVSKLAVVMVLFGIVVASSAQAEPIPLACFSSDIAALCCPGACAAKRGPKWTKADAILRGCMQGLGCSPADVKTATTFMKCNCAAP